MAHEAPHAGGTATYEKNWLAEPREAVNSGGVGVVGFVFAGAEFSHKKLFLIKSKN